MASSIATDASEFICLSCKKEYDTPKRLPCKHSICSNCEINGRIEIKCPTCEKTHKIPRSGFPINTSLVQENEKRRLRLDIEKRLRSAMSSLEQVKDDLSNRESIIGEYTDLLINDIDIKVESIINEIHAARDELLSKIKVYKEKCIKNSADLGHVKRMLERCNKSYDKCLKHFNEASSENDVVMLDVETDLYDAEISMIDTKLVNSESDSWEDITDSESDAKVEFDSSDDTVVSDSKKQQTRFEKSLNEITNLVDDINSCKKQFDSKLFGGKRLVFLESDVKITRHVIGHLSTDPWIKKIYENIKTQKSMSVYNYAIVEDEDEDEFKYTGAFCREIEENKIFLAASRSNDDLYDDTKCFDLFIFTLNGKAKKTLRIIPTCDKPEKNCRYGKLTNKRIVFAYDDTITIYDYNLKPRNRIELDDEEGDINALFVNENNEILVYTDTSLQKFDSSLNLIGSKTFVSDRSRRIDYDCYLALKSGKLYSFEYDCIKVFNHETLVLMRIIKLDSVVDVDYSKLFQLINEDRFVLVDTKTKKIQFFNFDMKCLCECKAQNVTGITSFSINEETGNLIINDIKTNNVFVIKQK